MSSAWRSGLHTSLKCSWGCPVGFFPVASSPYKRSFGMRPSFIRVTCPSHCMRLCFKRVYKLGIPAFTTTTLFVTLSCHVIPRIRLRQRMWNTFNLFSWCADLAVRLVTGDCCFPCCVDTMRWLWSVLSRVQVWADDMENLGCPPCIRIPLLALLVCSKGKETQNIWYQFQCIRCWKCVSLIACLL